MSLELAGSALIYLLGWFHVWRERKDEIVDHISESIGLFFVFLVITLVGDFTPYIPTSVFCAVVWPVFAIYILERYAEKPHVKYIESELKKINEDITEDQRLHDMGEPRLFGAASYRTEMRHRRDLLSQISRVFELL